MEREERGREGGREEEGMSEVEGGRTERVGVSEGRTEGGTEGGTGGRSEGREGGREGGIEE